MSEIERVLFRADARPSAGLGHLQRCLALATALAARGVSSTFQLEDIPETRRRVIERGFEAVALIDGTDPGEVSAAAERYECQAIVVDSYGIDETYLEWLRATRKTIAMIDDRALLEFPCQLVVNSAPTADSLTYRSSTGDTVFLLGPAYAMLREELWDVPRRKVAGRIERILLTLGGGDPHGLMPDLIREIAGLPGDFRLTVTVGPFFRALPALEAAAADASQSVELVHAPISVRDLMLDADLAVSAGGQTLYELARAGVPTVAIQVADNQTAGMRALEAAGVVLVAGEAGDSALLSRVREAVSHLTMAADVREAMSRAGQALIDGQGAKRVAAAILDL